MFTFFKNNKMTLGGGVALLLLVWVYFTYFGGGGTEPLSSPDTTAISGDLLVTLGSLHTIKLDNSLFSDPVFVSLSDFGVSLPPQAAGRRNPFAPVGQGNLSTTTAR
jgi:hypothetical protein